MQRNLIKLLHGSLVYRDKRLAGYNAATMVEIVDHLDATRLAAFERVMVGCAKPKHVVLTTPNASLHFIARKRLAAAGKLSVVDATMSQPEACKPLVELARGFHCLPVAIVLNLPERVCHDRNTGRSDRNFGPHVIRQQSTTAPIHVDSSAKAVYQLTAKIRIRSTTWAPPVIA